MALNVDKRINLHQEKEKSEFKVFSLEEIFYTIMVENLEEVYEEHLFKILSKKIKDEEVLFPLIATILDIIKIGYDFEDEINKLLFKSNVKLNKKEAEKFEKAINEYSYKIPLWLENGYSHCDIDDEFEDEDYFNEEFLSSLSLNERFEDKNIVETILTEDEQIKVYINTYIFLNGVIEIDTLKHILKTKHNYNVSKSKIISLTKSIEDLEIVENHIQAYGIDEEEIINDFNELGIKYNLDEDIIIELNSLMYLGEIPKEFLVMFFEEENIKISNDNLKKLSKDLKEISKKMPLWTLNGYKSSEYNANKIKKEKIGRKDLCTCGSGKKHKRCCGK